MVKKKESENAYECMQREGVGGKENATGGSEKKRTQMRECNGRERESIHGSGGVHCGPPTLRQ